MAAISQPTAEAPPQPVQDSAAAIPSVSAAYKEIESQALKEVAAGTQERDKRLTDRDAWLQQAYQLSPIQRLFTSPEAYRDYSNIVEKHAQRRTDEAQLPLADVIHRTNARIEAMRQATEQNKLAVTDFYNRQLMKKADGGSDESQLAREYLKTYAPGVAKALPANISALALEPFFKATPELAKGYEAYRTGQKAGAEAGQVALTAASERELRAAQAEKAKAEAQVEQMKIGSEPAPDYERAGPYNPENDKELQNKDAANRTLNSELGGVLETLGNRNIVPTLRDPKGAAQIQSTLKQHAFALKKQSGIRLNPATEKMIDDMVGDPTKLTAGNALGQAKIRLQTNLDSENQEHRDWVGSHQFRFKPSHPIHGANAPKTSAQRVNVIAPDGSKHNIPESQVKLAQKKGYRLAGQ